MTLFEHRCNKERHKSQPPRRRNQEESSNPEQKELENRISMGESSRRNMWKRNRRSTCEEGNSKLLCIIQQDTKKPIKKDTRKESVRKWQINGRKQRKERLLKNFFPNVKRILIANLNLKPNVTTIMNDDGNI